MRAGAGKLTIATVRSVAVGIALAIPEARVIALPETAAGGLLPSGAPLLDAYASCSSAVLIGPGLLDGAGSCEFILALLRQLKGVPVILDALAMDVLLRTQRFDEPVLLTPHAGEMAHLTGRSKDSIVADAPGAARDMAIRTNAVVVLKGATTFIVSPQGGEWRHVSATPGLGTSGSGDVLARVMTGFAARGASLEQAAAWGVGRRCACAGRQKTRRSPWTPGFSCARSAEGNSVGHGPHLSGAPAGYFVTSSFVTK